MAPTASLSLPAPKNATEDALNLPSKAARVEDVDEVTEQSMSSASKYAATGGLIYPPPELRALVDKTATFVARNGAQFESKIKEDGMGRNKLAFLNEQDPYHAYYRAKIEAVRSGSGPLAGTDTSSRGSPFTGLGADLDGIADKTVNTAKPAEEVGPPEPEPFRFLADLPSITSMDLDIVKLTALFTARKGRSFASTLSAREGRSYQFEFLRPSHSLFGYFNRLVEQYRLVMEPTEEIRERVRAGAFGGEEELREPVLGVGRGGARLKVLEQIRTRAEWQKWDKAKRKQVEEEEEKDRATFNEIDWQDFVVAGTVELTETDAHVDLPPPMSLREVESMSMAQKKMAAMIQEIGGGEDEEADLNGQVNGVSTTTNAAGAGEDTNADMEMDESEDESVVRPAAATNGPIKIRKDYQPKTLAERKAAAASQTTICPVCKASVPLNQMDEHVKYELLNPHYREQRRELESKKAQHNTLLQGVDPSASLRQFAGRRTDIFGSAAEEEAQRRKEEEEARKRKEREKMVWDGHAASRMDTAKEFTRPEQLQEEMQHIQKKFKTDQEKVYIGPQTTAPLPPPSGPNPADSAPPPAFSGNSMSAGAVSYNGPPSMPPHMMAHMPPQDGYGSYQAYPGYPYQPQQQYVLEKRTDGTLHPEDQWIRYHPESISITVQLPEASSVSQQCDGSAVPFEDLPPTTTIGIVRDRIQSETLAGSVGASRLKLRVEGKPTTLKQTLAHWNLVSGDVITLQLS